MTGVLWEESDARRPRCPRSHCQCPLCLCSSCDFILYLLARRRSRAPLTRLQVLPQPLSLFRLPELPDALEGDVHPVGTVVELVVQFIDGLFQQVSIQEHLTLIPSRG